MAKRRSQHGIPTTYGGIKFRSRLEARWAAYWDLQGNTWHYEPIDLPGWIPDFLLEVPGIEPPVLCEIKPIANLGTFLRSRDSIKMAHAILQSRAQIEAKNFHGLMLCGIRPGCMWTLAKGEGFIPVRPYDDALGTLAQYWIEAGNIVQWKAPR